MYHKHFLCLFPLYDESLAVFFSCKSLWIKASTTWINSYKLMMRKYLRDTIMPNVMKTPSNHQDYPSNCRATLWKTSLWNRVENVHPGHEHPVHNGFHAPHGRTHLSHTYTHTLPDPMNQIHAVTPFLSWDWRRTQMTSCFRLTSLHIWLILRL